MSGFVVAIDGPAAAGKSTTARLVAERLGFLYLDTGAMYRALTWQVLEEGLDLGDTGAIAALAESSRLEMVEEQGERRVLLNGADVSERIRGPRISRSVSRVAQVPAVRRRMVQLQREIAEGASCVVEGRDIGTVVFPGAPVKIFLAASLEERARRRQAELRTKGLEQSLEGLTEEIRTRDAVDSEREHSPLRRADDAIMVDTTGMSVEEQVEAVAEIVRQARARAGDAPHG